MLPVGNEPVLGRHLTDLIELIRERAATLFMGHNSIANTGTTYLRLNTTADTATHVQAKLVMPRDATVANLRVRHLVAGTSANRARYTVLRNDEPTALTVDVVGTSTAHVVSALRVPVVAGDLLSVRVTRPDGSLATAPTDVAFSFEVI